MLDNMDFHYVFWFAGGTRHLGILLIGHLW